MRVGLLLPGSGPAAIWRLGCEACAELAASEVNAAGGVRRRPLEIVHADAGATPETAAAAAADLAGRVDAVVGMQPSHQRNAVRRAIAGRAPYIYTPQYEGGWCGPAVAALAVTDTEVLGPAVDWLLERHGARRFFFVGNDYVWPRVAHGAAADAVREAGGRLVGSALIRFGERDYDPLIDRIRAARPDALVTVLLGQEAVSFHRAAAEAGLAAIMPRIALACDETLLWALGPENSENLIAGQAFFDGAAPGQREAVVDRYAARFGRTRPPLTGMTISVYDGVRLAAAFAGEHAEGEGPQGPHLAARMGGRFARKDAMRMLGLDPGRPRPPVILAEADGAAFRPRLTV